MIHRSSAAMDLAQSLISIALVISPAGCFIERSFPLRESDRPGLQAARERMDAGQLRSTRDWLEAADADLRSALPDQARPTMTTSRMVDDQGRPRDVYAYFDRQVEKMQSMLTNWWALQHSAQSIEHATTPLTPPPWPGFEQVWIPVSPDVRSAGFLGLVRRDGRIVDADCIVLLPGLWGDNGARRSRDLSEALVRNGYHVLSIEPRGHGMTDVRYPEVPYTYGLLETQDLMRTSEWLQDTYPQIHRTGLMGFCWGANAALIAAWYDGRRPDDPSISENLKRLLDPPTSRRHFEMGVMAFSPVLQLEAFIDRMEVPHTHNTDLAASMFQNVTRDHMRYKGYPEVTGSLRRCIDYEFAASELGPSFPSQEGYQFVRLLPYRGMPTGDKLEFSRVPVLIVHSVNDPLMTAQEVPDLMARTHNPKVAALVLPGGGHIGFQAWSRKYFYRLILSFFDPVSGTAAVNSTQTGSGVTDTRR